MTQEIKELLNYDNLRSSGQVPRTHPNGFIQFDLLEDPNNAGIRTRLHIWPNISLNKQKSDHFIHDHRFDMKSTILLGTMINRVYEFVDSPDGVEEEYIARYSTRYDSFLAKSGRKGFTKVIKTEVVYPGQSYTLPTAHLHSSLPKGFCATFMQSTKGYPRQTVRVIIPAGTAVDNEFDRFTANPSEVLWGQIKLVCDKINLKAMTV